ncbi:MAG: hypothetical protein EA425_12190, partial [Puniceicoccaceae bacterium]
GKLRIAGDGLWLRGRLDTASEGPFASFIAPTDGRIGSAAEGSLYLSFLLQLPVVPSSGSRQNWLQLADSTNGWANRLRIGQDWAADHFSIGGTSVASLDTAAHLVVLRLDYSPSGDTVTGWWDPDPDNPESVADPSLVQSGLNLRFDSLSLLAQGTPEGFFVDEIRFGTSWEAVLPTTDLVVHLGTIGEGSVSAHPAPAGGVYQPGQDITLTAHPEPGWHFSHWSGGHQGFDNPAAITIGDAPLDITAHFSRLQLVPFPTEPDPFLDTALLDLRHLNEPFAGSKGWIVEDGRGGLMHEATGETVRFWTVNAGVAPDMPSVRDQARFFAKRGVNHVRWHTSVFSNQAPSLDWVDPDKVAEVQRMVAAHQAEGIYTSISYFFVLGLRIQAAWGIPGYDSAWLAAHPDLADRAPFGLMFFEPLFQDAMQRWIEVILTTPNPYDDNRPLAENPAVAIVEILNEDNLFFYTFDPASFPPAQRDRIYQHFGDFAASRHGSIAEAFDAWQAEGGSAAISGDQPSEGRLAVTSAWEMGQSPGANPARNRRLADQIEFLALTQRDFFAAFSTFIRGLGYRGPITASNWTTANAGRGHLLDIEHWTYAQGAGVIDVHNYYNALGVERSLFTRLSGGDRYIPLSAVNAPRRMPAVYRHLRGHASFLSESTWTQPNDFRSEAALLTAAFGALNGLDGFTWFSAGPGDWQDGTGTWQVWTPNLGGLFPGAALLYRRGDVSPGPVVVRETINLRRAFHRERSFMAMTGGYDPTRDAGADFDFDPASGEGRIDPLAFLVGRAEALHGRHQAHNSVLPPTQPELIDFDQRRLRSLTGELELHWDEPAGRIVDGQPSPGRGLFTLDSPRTQAAAGFLGAAGPLDLGDVRIHLENTFGSVLVTALDDLPIAQSSRLLVQVGTRDQLTGFRTSEENRTLDGLSFLGRRVEEVGALPWQIESPEGSILLKDPDRAVTGAWLLDANGYPLPADPVMAAEAEGWRIELPRHGLYLVVDLAPPAVYRPVIATAALPTGDLGQPYQARLETLSGTPPHTWSATGLPPGLSLADGGHLEGAPLQGGLFEVALHVADAAGQAATRNVSLAIIPIEADAILPESFAQWLERHFTPEERADPSLADPAATPAGDRYANAFKYLLGIDPFTPAPASLIKVEVVDSFLHLRFPVALHASNVEFTVLYAPEGPDGAFTADPVEPVAAETDPDGIREWRTLRAPLGPGGTGAFRLRLIDPSGEAWSGPLDLALDLPPAIELPPQPARVPEGTSVTLRVRADGIGPLVYSWTRDGSPIPGAAGPELHLPAGPSQVGTYQVHVSNFHGAVAGPSVVITHTPAGALPVNVSTRGFVGQGGEILIAGLVLQGPGSGRILLRGIGPGLATFFDPSLLLLDPELILRDHQGQPIESNTSWLDHPRAAEIAATAFAPGHHDDTAILRDLEAGIYTVWLRGRGGDTGLGLIEVYALEALEGFHTGPLPVNLSTRGRTGPGANTLIAGFVISGNHPRSILLRGVGPGLRPFFSENQHALLLAHPRTTLFDPNALALDDNQGWPDHARATEIGALPFRPHDSADAANLVDLDPGIYTAWLRGDAGATGLGLIEIYVLEP